MKLACTKCGKDTFTSTSGRTLHENSCKGPKAKAVGPKVVKSAIVAPTQPFGCEGRGVGATLCGELADYRLIYEEDEVEAFAYSCARCKAELKAKYNPKKIVPLTKPKGIMGPDGIFKPKPEKAAPIKVKPEHQKALDELIEFADDYWTQINNNPKLHPLKEDTILLNDMIEEVSKYPGCEISAALCKLSKPKGKLDW